MVERGRGVRKKVYWSDQAALAEIGEQVGGLPSITGHSSSLTREANRVRRQVVALEKRLRKRSRGQVNKPPLNKFEENQMVSSQPKLPGDGVEAKRFIERLEKTRKIIDKGKQATDKTNH